MSDDHQKWMSYALLLAEQGRLLGEVPVGAVVVFNNELVGEGFNQPISSSDPSAHAEIVALRDAAKNLNNYRLPQCSLYVTIEPCTMCVGAIIHARISQLIFGACEPRAGAVISKLQLLQAEHYNHQISVVEGIMSEQCSQLISDFFHQKRKFNAKKKAPH